MNPLKQKLFLNNRHKHFHLPFENAYQSLNHIKMASVKQQWPDTTIKNTEQELAQTLSALTIPEPDIKETVGIAVGSRGIDHLQVVVKQCITFLKDKGYDPFIIPAMGSHGGATPEGQRHVLKTFGITEETMKVPILADMATLQIGEYPPNIPVHFSQTANHADHIVVINRIKSHTKFHAPLESGLCKMLCIGLGKAAGASEYHLKAVSHGFSWIESIAQMIIQKHSVLFGLALIENQYGQLAHIEAISGSEIPDREKQLLVKAKQLMPSIPFDGLDVLIIDEIGKNISGIGMDSNITGRHRDIIGDFFDWPHVKRIFVRGLSSHTNGNANGIGLADVVTSQCVESIDFEKTYMNALTALSPEKATIPLFFDTDKDCLAVCLHTIGLKQATSIRMVWIQNTAQLNQFMISEGLKNELYDKKFLSRTSDWETIKFDETNKLIEFYPFNTSIIE